MDTLNKIINLMQKDAYMASIDLKDAYYSVKVDEKLRGGGGNFHKLGYGMCHFLRVLFGWKINFWVSFIACNKFLGQDFSLE